jgi:hypothetical protein
MMRRMIDKLLLRRGALAAAAALVLALAWLGPLDRLSQEYVESGFKRALITFALARTANALISVAQETTVAIQPFGLGVTVSPAQVLDPLNDLVEQFSTLMLIACVSFAVQRILIEIGGFVWVSVFLTAALIAWAWWTWRGVPAPTWLTRILLVLLLVRFAVPLAALGSEGVFRVTMSTEYAQAQSAVHATAEDIRVMSPDNYVKGSSGAFDRLKEWWDRKKQDLQATFDQLKDKAENMVRHIVVLMALFTVQTLVLPLLFLWGVQRLFRGALSWSAPAT